MKKKILLIIYLFQMLHSFTFYFLTKPIFYFYEIVDASESYFHAFFPTNENDACFQFFYKNSIEQQMHHPQNYIDLYIFTRCMSRFKSFYPKIMIFIFLFIDSLIKTFQISLINSFIPKIGSIFFKYFFEGIFRAKILSFKQYL